MLSFVIIELELLVLLNSAIMLLLEVQRCTIRGFVLELATVTLTCTLTHESLIFELDPLQTGSFAIPHSKVIKSACSAK